MNSIIIWEYFSKLNPFTTPSASANQAAVSKPVDRPILNEPKRKADGKALKMTGSVFADDVVIEGSINSESDIIIRGHIKGGVTSKGNVELRGCVDGDVCGKNVAVSKAHVKGNVRAEESLSVQDSVISGDLYSQNADIDSIVNGNIATDGILVVRKSACIRGDITAVSISVEKNAVLEGRVTIQQK